MKQEKSGVKPFLSLIVSTKIPKVALTIGLIGSIITTIVGLSIPLLTRELVDGFSTATISVSIIIAIAAVFILQGVIDGVSTYLLASVGQTVSPNYKNKRTFSVRTTNSRKF